MSPRARSLLLWIAIPVAFFGGVEGYIASVKTHWQTFGYQNAETMAGGRRIEFLFVGTSRTAAAIDATEVGRVLAERVGRPVYGINSGAGATTLHFHYLGLRNFWRRAPGSLRGCTVLIEAPRGIPEFSTWKDPWFYEELRQPTVTHLESQDISPLWRSGMSAELKCDATIRWLARGSKFLASRNQTRQNLLRAATRTVAAALPAAPEAAATDLSAVAGIRTDAEGVQLARKALRDWLPAERRVLERTHGGDWDKSVLADIVELVRSNGGRVAFFEMPLYRDWDALYDGPERDADREAFARVAGQWRAPILRPDFKATDADFPDGWHLRKSLAPVYSRAVADALLAASRRPAPTTTPVGSR